MRPSLSEGRDNGSYGSCHAEAIGKVKCELEILDNKMKSSEDEDKVGKGLAELNTKMDRTKVELEAKIDMTRTELEARIDKTKADLEEKICRAKVETICWTIGIVISVCSLQGYIIVNMLK